MSSHRRNHVCQILVERFSGYGVLTPQKLPFPIDLLRRPYNSVALPCDTLKGKSSHLCLSKPFFSIFNSFLPARRSASAGLSYGNVSVRPSLTVSKVLND